MASLIFIVYLGASILFLIGLAGVAFLDNFLKKIYALGFMQGAVILFFIAISFRENSDLPIFDYSLAKDVTPQMVNPIPHVLMLTAIVVGVALLALAISILNTVTRRYQTLSESSVKSQILSERKNLEERFGSN